MKKGPMAHLYQAQIREIKKTEDALASIITIMKDMFNSILTRNVKWVEMSFYNDI